MRASERVRPLLIASVLTGVFFFGRFWAAPLKEIFPSGILAALRYYLLSDHHLMIAVLGCTNTDPSCSLEQSVHIT
jgi:hypothetical protein